MRAYLTILLLTFAVLNPVFASPTYDVVPVASHMQCGRWAPAAAALPGDRNAVIAGGYDFATGQCTASIDVYDLATSSFTPSHASLTTPCDFAQAVRLGDGTVLIAGGFNDDFGTIATAQIYDPTTDTVHATGSMCVPRELFQAIVLPDGRVFATGGLNLRVHGTVASCEIYTPDIGKWSLTASMAQDRFGHAACLLADGRVFLVGGTSAFFSRKNGRSVTLATAEIYDPLIASFTPVPGALSVGRDRPTATLLPDGRVLIVGGQAANGLAVTTAEIFDPATGQFSVLPSPPLSPRMAHASTALPDGRVLAVGGWDAVAKATTASAVIIDAAGGAVEILLPLPFAPHDQAQVLLAGGAVLVAGGKVVTPSGAASSCDGGALLRPVGR